MSWFLVDDQFPADERVLAISLAARGLWVMAGSWASTHHTDVVPAHVLASLGSTPELVTELVTARVWRKARGGYRIEQEGLCKIATQETVDNQKKMKTERQRRWRESQGRRAVDASTGPSTWDPGPDPGSNPGVHVVNRVNGSNGHPPTAVIDAIIKEIHDKTGKLVDDDWAGRIAAELLQGQSVSSPAAYVRQAIRNEPNPGLRFLPQYGRHSRQETP